MEDRITLAHGSGGVMTHELISNIFFKYFDNDILRSSDDSAVLEAGNERLAFTTDSFVVKPLFFPGGDIGKLAICGTVNDLSVNGARPLYISCGFIIEEGFSQRQLEDIVKSMSCWAKEAGVKIVTGDTKVVEKGSCDGIFINTSGIGIIDKSVSLGIDKISAGDKIILTGTIAEHGMAVLSKRESLNFESDILSDCAPLNHMLLGVCGLVKFMRDPTRGGVATTLNEIVDESGFGIVINESDIPVSDEVRAGCELLGLDPLYIANEGRALIVADPKCEKEILGILQSNKYGQGAKTIGEVSKEDTKKLCLNTNYGIKRIVDMPQAELIPRIC